jgi:hypothetical protein
MVNGSLTREPVVARISTVAPGISIRSRFPQSGIGDQPETAPLAPLDRKRWILI